MWEYPKNKIYMITEMSQNVEKIPKNRKSKNLKYEKCWKKILERSSMTILVY
jgi:hypothetical protein